LKREKRRKREGEGVPRKINAHLSCGKKRKKGCKKKERNLVVSLGQPEGGRKRSRRRSIIAHPTIPI